ncbi:sporulation kinase [Candidatus Magnetoovum chiemensis]|nr:sporulation kinase [Candidatus Magnetoovum chiemensis]
METEEKLNIDEELIKKERLEFIEQLFSSAGHELRNPLGVISNSVFFLNMILKDQDEKVKKHLNIIKSEIDRAAIIISQIIDCSKTGPPNLAKSNLNSVINQAVLNIYIPENIRIKAEFDLTLPTSYIDSQQITQLFINLITNSIEAMPSGGELKIQTSITNNCITTQICDTGCGISNENIAKIYEPFFTTKTKGRGLGLFIARKIVERHHGTTTVDSKLNEGTCVTIKLPA